MEACPATSRRSLLGLNAVSYLAVLAGLLAMRREELHPVERPQTPPSMLGGTAEGLRHVRRTPATLMALVIVFVLSTLSFNFNVLLPVLAAQTLAADAGVFGLVAAMSAPARWSARSWQPRSAGRAGRCSSAPLPGSGGAARARARAQRHRRSRAPLRRRSVLHAVDVRGQRDRPALDAGSAAGPRDRAYFFAFNGAGPAGGVLAGWLAARGGTELAFAVSGASALAMAVAATVLRSRDTRGYASASLSEP